MFIVALGINRYNDEQKRWEVVRDDITPKLYDIEDHIAEKHNDLVAIFGEMGTGKSYLAAYLNWLYIQGGKKVIILSPKTYPVGQEHDFFWIEKQYDVSKAIPNPFLPERISALVNSLQVCFIAKIKNIGITAINIKPLLDEIVKQKPKNWDDVHRIIGKMKKSQQSLAMALDTIENIVSQVALPINEEAINFDESCLFEFGGFGENADIQKAFYMEMISNIIFQQEQSRMERDYVLCVDESHYLLKYAEAGSCLNSILRMGRLAFSLILCSQHLADVHQDLRQTGSVFEFYTTHEDTSTYLKNVAPFLRDCVGLVKKNEFCDVKQEVDSKNRIGYIFKVIDSRFEEFIEKKRQVREKSEKPQLLVTKVVPIETVPREEEENLKEKAVEVLESSDECLHGYALTKRAGVMADDVNSRRRIVRNLLAEEKIKEWDCQIRQKVKTFYYLANDNRDPCHNFMMNEVEKKINSGWKIEFKATHGIQGADFILEKEGKKVALESETGLKNDIVDLQDRIAKNQVENIPSIIVVPTSEKKIFYQSLFDCKVVLIPELEEALRN